MKNLFIALFAVALAAGGTGLALAQSSPLPVMTPVPLVTPAAPATPFTPPSSLPPTGPLTTPLP